MMKIVLASKNAGKLCELMKLAGDVPWLELTLAPQEFSPKETGTTFFENAAIKAREAATLTGLPALADDSGLIVEALNGQPGIHSARYCHGNDQQRCLKLLKEMAHIPNGRRDAAFLCSMVLVNQQGEILHSVTRAWPGRIGFEAKGENGFGYDPIFYLMDKEITAAQLSPEEKNKLSHRGQAWRAMLSYLLSSTSANIVLGKPQSN
ncbi:MAG: RdgB/HAM1 family non-canonical purine NTP pyrophosphatase [Candidatus Melainabacteria bacterium]|nr:RdgB/HAM1 family non-canonical purine NTP pyrophosphatase [Candidatus Melainabacteria bacterium]